MLLMSGSRSAKTNAAQFTARRLSGSTALAGGVVAALLVFAPAKVQAQTWDGETNTLWGTGTNWNADVVPAGGGVVIINGAGGPNQPTLNVASAALASTAISAGTLIVDNTLTSTTVTLSGTGNLTINATRQVIGNVTQGGTGTLLNSGTITGNLVISDGITTNAGVVTGTTTISGGTLNLNLGTDLANAQPLTVSGTGILNVNAADQVGALAQTGGTIQGGSLLLVTGLYNQSGGATGGTVNIEAGSFTQSGGATLAVGTTVNSAGAKTLEGGTIAGTLGGAGATTIQTGVTTVTGTITGDVTIASGTLNINNSNAIGGSITTTGSVINYANGVNEASALILNSNTTQLSVGAADVATQSGIISELGGARPLEKIGTGTLILSSANTYTGITTITAGVLNIQNATGLGTTAGGTVVTAGAALQLQGGIAVGAEALTLNGTGVANDGALRNIADANSYAGAVTLASASRINSDAGTLTLTGGITGAGQNLTVGGAGNTTIASAITTGAGTLNKDGAGVLILSGVNTYAGPTTVSGGTLTLQGGAAIADTGAVNIDTAGATLNVAAAETIGSLAGVAGSLMTLGATLTTGDATSTTFAGVASGAGGITKEGAGTFTLSGNSAAFAGTTNVNAGTLLMTGNIGGTVNVNNGGTLGGTGFVGTALLNTTVNNGGTLAAGLSPGTLNIVGNLVLNAGSNSSFELGTPQVIGGATNDLINVGGNLSVAAGANLIIAAPGVSGYYRLFNVTGTGAATAANFTVNTPGGFTSRVYTESPGGPNQVNLLLSAGDQSVQFWDGADATGGTAGPGGGAGTWDATTTNWTQPAGVINDSWQQGVGIFGPAAGAVTVTGTQNFQGLQFTASGYTLTGGQLNMTGNPFGNASASFINTDAGTTTTINSVISGGAGIGLDKLGGGTLILTAVNTFTGLTTVTAGTLTNNGTLPGAVTNNAVFGNNGTVGGLVTNNAAFNNNAAGVVNGGLLNQAGTTTNAGIINGGATVTGGTLNTSGTLNGGLTNAATTNASGNITGGVTNTGAFSVNGPLNNNGGVFTNNGTGTLTVGAFALSGVSTLTNNSTSPTAVSVAAGGSIAAVSIANNAGTFSNAGTLTAPTFANAASATLTNTGAITAATSFSNAGMLTNSGTLTGGAVSNSGTATSTGTITATSFSNTGAFSASGTFNGGAATNTGQFVVTGNLGGATTSFGNNAGGSVNLTGGNFTGITTFNNAGTVNIAGTRTLGAAGFNNLATGVVSMANGAAGDRLTLTGNYVGTPGSAINLDVNTATRAADVLTINGAATGSSAINVNLVGQNAFVFTTPVDVVVAGAGSSLTTDRLGRIGTTRGFFDYFLRANPANAGGFQVVSQFNSGAVSGVASGVAGVINSLQAGFHQPSSAIISRPDNCQPNQLMGGPFLRLNAGETTVRSSSTASSSGLTSDSSTKSNSRFSGGQGGVDLGICNVNNSGWNLHAGVMGGFVSTKATGISSTPNPGGAGQPALRTRTQIDMEVPFFGGYFFATNGPFTAEFNVRKDDYKSKVTAFDPDVVAPAPFVGPNQRLRGDGLSFNGSMSYRFTYGENAYLEPAVGLSKGSSRFNNLPFATNPGDFMSFSNSESLLGRIGFNAGVAVSVTDNLVVVPFVSMSVWREFAKPTKARAIFPDKGPSGSALAFDVETDRVGTFGQFGAGVQFRILDTPLLGFLRADMRVGEKIEGKAINAGLRLQF